MEVLLGALVSIIVQVTKGKMSRNMLHVFVLGIGAVVAVVLYFAGIFPSVDAFVQSIVAISVSAIGIYELLIKRILPLLDSEV